MFAAYVIFINDQLYYLLLDQIQDYGVVMKLDDGNLMLASMIRLFKVFLHFPGSDASEYRKCMLVNLLLWAHYSNKQLPIFDMVKHNASMCNEESGELAFSVLARTISSNSSRNNHWTFTPPTDILFLVG